MSELTERLISWAQNEEMIDQYYTDHGKDCMDAVDQLERMQALLHEVACCGVEFEDERVRYVTIQIDKETLDAIRALDGVDVSNL